MRNVHLPLKFKQRFLAKLEEDIEYNRSGNYQALRNSIWSFPEELDRIYQGVEPPVLQRPESNLLDANLFLFAFAKSKSSLNPVSCKFYC